MSINNNENEIQVESEFNSVNINHKDCFKPYKPPLYCKLWCKECIPCDQIIEGWTSGNNDIDKFIKDTIYNAKYYYYDNSNYALFLEWVPYYKFTDVKLIGEGGFTKVYSAIWIDGKSKYSRQRDGSWKKLDNEPMKVILKRLNGSQNISAEYLNELKTYWKLFDALKFHGITKDPKTKEFMMIMDFANKGSLKDVLSNNNFNKILWEDKIYFLLNIAMELKTFHNSEYCHKNLHSGNILQHYNNDSIYATRRTYISDFGLSSRPADVQRSDDKIYGVLPYIAPEVLNGEPYTLSSDIYSLGVIMVELSSGKPPFYDKKHDNSLALAICKGLRPEFGNGTPNFYKMLAYRCMDANPNQRPTVVKLFNIFEFWNNSIADYNYHYDIKQFGYSRKGIHAGFKKADKAVSNISTSYKENPDAIFTSRAFTFSNLSRPINSSIITSCNDKNRTPKNRNIGRRR